MSQTPVSASSRGGGIIRAGVATSAVGDNAKIVVIGGGAGGDPIALLHHTNRKYRRQRQSLRALAGKESVYCEMCRMRFFYPANQLHRYIRWIRLSGGGNDGEPETDEETELPFFECRICGCNSPI